MKKKGFLRLVEASIAVLILITALFFFSLDSREQNETDLSQTARDILQEMSQDFSLREAIINSEISEIPQNQLDEFVSKRISNQFLDFEIKVCDLNEVCGFFVDGNVYVAERIFSANSETYSPKKVKLFIWYKK